MSDFFAIEAPAWNKACDASFHAAAAYLIMARGTGGDQRTTAWSAHSIERYTIISRSQAKAAIAELITAGLVRQDKGGKRPVYYLLPQATEPDWIWLPNAIVDGAGDEKPPVALLVEAYSATALRLFVELYHAHDLPSHGGIPKTMLWRTYRRERIGECGPCVVWGFEEESTVASGKAPFVHLTGKWEKLEDGTTQDTAWRRFWDALNLLTMTGLLYPVAHVAASEGPDSPILHPLAPGMASPWRSRSAPQPTTPQSRCFQIIC
jgi:hypothetical protein